MRDFLLSFQLQRFCAENKPAASDCDFSFRSTRQRQADLLSSALYISTTKQALKPLSLSATAPTVNEQTITAFIKENAGEESKHQVV